MLKNIITFKIPFQTTHFNKNQKVWVVRTTGDLACKVVGKFRGKNKYISAWVNYDNNKEKPLFKEIEIEESFFNFIISKANQKSVIHS